MQAAGEQVVAFEAKEVDQEVFPEHVQVQTESRGRAAVGQIGSGPQRLVIADFSVPSAPACFAFRLRLRPPFGVGVSVRHSVLAIGVVTSFLLPPLHLPALVGVLVGGATNI
jgi:hypothetical protein